MAKAIKGRMYQHKKGGYYIVIDIGKHTETLEEMVIYQKLEYEQDYGWHKTGEIWIRPRAMFEDIGRFILYT